MELKSMLIVGVLLLSFLSLTVYAFFGIDAQGNFYDCNKTCRQVEKAPTAKTLAAPIGYEQSEGMFTFLR